jgi:hypothetical protein
LQQCNQMLTIKECRELLKDDAKELSDEQIIEVREWLSMMADIIIEQVESDYLKSNTHENGNKKESDTLYKGINR